LKQHRLVMYLLESAQNVMSYILPQYIFAQIVAVKNLKILF